MRIRSFEFHIRFLVSLFRTFAEGFVDGGETGGLLFMRDDIKGDPLASEVEPNCSRRGLCRSLYEVVFETLTCSWDACDWLRFPSGTVM